jgi:hypothetical protein
VEITAIGKARTTALARIERNFFMVNSKKLKRLAFASVANSKG